MADTDDELQGAKKWHCMKSDGTASRYSLSELFLALAEEKLSNQDKIWCEGMEDWQKIEDVDLEKWDDALSAGSKIRPRSNLDFYEKPSSSAGPSYTISKKQKQKQKRFPLHPRQVAYAFGSLLVLAFAFYAIRSPYTLPKLENVFENEYADLEQVLDSDQIKSAVAISKIDSETPIFHVAAPVEDGEFVEVVLYGIESKIVGRPRILLRQEIMMSRGYGMTDPFSYQSKSLPVGEYVVYSRPLSALSDKGSAKLHGDALLYALATDSQPTIKSLDSLGYSENVYFLGGARDDQYINLLNQYLVHQKKEAAFEQKELSETLKMQSNLFRELKKVSSTLSFKESNSLPDSLKNRLEGFSKSKNSLSLALNTWTPKVINNEYLNTHAYYLSRQLSLTLLQWGEGLSKAQADVEKMKRLSAESQKTATKLMGELKTHL